VGTIFDALEKPLSGNEHESLYLFDSELPDTVNATIATLLAAASSESDLRDVDVLASGTGQRADAHSTLGSRPSVRSTANAAFVAGLVTALVLIGLAGQFAAVFTREHMASGPFDGELPPLPASPWIATHVDVDAVQPAMLSAEELSGETFPSATTTPLILEGSLIVESNPAGADVFIDGVRVGTTPIVLPNQREGTRAVRVEAKRHEPWTAAVQIVTGREVSLRADLNVAQSAAEPPRWNQNLPTGLPLSP
jgi:PEGA domain-containing protein